MPDDPRLMSIEEPLPDDPVTPPADDDDAEPEGVQEVSGRRMVDVSVVAAERKRARESTERKIRETEIAPLKQKADKADALQQALDAIKPQIDQLRQQYAPPQPQEPQISDADAEQEARDLQLYKPDSTLDVATAKKIIARRRNETQQAATEAARAVAEPLQAETAKTASRQNFAAMCSLKDADGNPLVDPKVLAQEWVTLPADLTQHQQVAETVLNAAIGKMARAGKRPVRTPEREPVYSESPGGRAVNQAVLTENAKKLGLTKTDLESSAKTFVPGNVSEIGSW